MSAAVASRPAESLFRDARRRLADAGIDSADLDASLLLEHAAGVTVLARITDPDRAVAPDKVERFEACITRRLAREPVHRIIGEREFYGLPLSLNAATLVPRPDTETLVDLVLPFVRERAALRGICRILDLGTGSGAIALALLACEPQTIAVGSDMSEDALEAAAANAARLGFSDRFETARSDWFADISGHFDLIVSNPPYIRSAEIGDLSPDVRDHDPLAALDGGDDGLEAYRVLASQSRDFLEPDGAVAVEIGHDQKAEVIDLFEAAGLRLSADRRDYAGHDRALFFEKL